MSFSVATTLGIAISIIVKHFWVPWLSSLQDQIGIRD